LIFTLYLFATESDKFGHCNPVPLPPNLPNKEFSGSHTAIGTHSRFTRQFLGYAQRERLARTLFYDFPVIPDIRCFLEQKGRFGGSGLCFDGQSLAS
jgi:hypothetical protein